jgi:hypothetical protein
MIPMKNDKSAISTHANEANAKDKPSIGSMLSLLVGWTRAARLTERTVAVFTTRLFFGFPTELHSAETEDDGNPFLFDHLVGKREQLVRNIEPERLGSLDVDD